MFAKSPDRAAREGRTDAGSAIDSDLLVEGNLKGAARLYIEGCIEGDVSCDSLVQGEKSRIRGKIVAKNVQLAGEVVGVISAERVFIGPTARIAADMTYETIAVESGAIVEGQITLVGPGTLRSAQPGGANSPEPIEATLSPTSPASEPPASEPASTAPAGTSPPSTSASPTRQATGKIMRGGAHKVLS